MSPSTILEYGGLLVRAGCTEAATLTWLEEFLSPAFNVRDTGSAAYSVEIIADEGVYRATAQRGPQRNGERAACFAFDHGPIHLPWWTGDGEERCIWDEVAKVFYCFDANHTRVRVLIDRRRPSRRISLMRAVREFAISHSWSRTSIVVHGASLVVGETGIAIVGAKGAGKTSLLTHLLLHAPGSSFVSNDRVVMELDATHTVLRGMPTVVQVQAPTFTLFPGLRERLLPEWDHRLALRERPASVRFPEPGQARQLTPAQFCRLVDTPMRGRAKGNVVLFPRLDESCDGLALEPVSSTLAAARLREHLLGGPHPALSEVFTLSPATIDAQVLDRICHEIATRARCFECRLGRNAYQSAFSLRWLDHLAATGATHE